MSNGKTMRCGTYGLWVLLPEIFVINNGSLSNCSVFGFSMFVLTDEEKLYVVIIQHFKIKKAAD